MAYENTIENNGEKVVTRYYGVVTSSEIYAVLEERFSDVEKIKKYRVIISDFTDVNEESQFQDIDIARLVRTFKHAFSHNSDIIYVGIMPSDLQFGLGRAWEAHINDIPIKEKIVRTRKEAQLFLDEIGI